MLMGGRVEAAIRPPRRTPWRWAGTLGLAFLMTACTAQETRGPVDYDLTEATRLFSVGYQDISDIYIDEISVSQLALAGLGNLSEIDSEISAISAGGYLTLSMSGHPVGTFKAPDRDDADGWGDFCDNPSVFIGQTDGTLQPVLVLSTLANFVTVDLTGNDDPAQALVVIECPGGDCTCQLVIP